MEKAILKGRTADEQIRDREKLIFGSGRFDIRPRRKTRREIDLDRFKDVKLRIDPLGDEIRRAEREVEFSIKKDPLGDETREMEKKLDVNRIERQYNEEMELEKERERMEEDERLERDMDYEEMEIVDELRDLEDETGVKLIHYNGFYIDLDTERVFDRESGSELTPRDKKKILKRYYEQEYINQQTARVYEEEFAPKMEDYVDTETDEDDDFDDDEKQWRRDFNQDMRNRLALDLSFKQEKEREELETARQLEQVEGEAESGEEVDEVFIDENEKYYLDDDNTAYNEDGEEIEDVNLTDRIIWYSKQPNRNTIDGTGYKVATKDDKDAMDKNYRNAVEGKEYFRNNPEANMRRPVPYNFEDGLLH